MSAPVPLDDTTLATLSTWMTAHDAHAPGLVEGLYVVGSTALDDRQPGSDIDIVAVTAEPADDETFDAIVAAVSEFVARRADDNGWVDGPYVSWGDLSVPPATSHRPWTAVDALHHDAECFDINPITWYVLAKHAITLRGPHPGELSIYLDAGDRVNFVRENVDTYWRPWHDNASRGLDEATETTSVASERVTWGVLGACRMWFTSATGDVASKTGAGLWAAEHLPPPDSAMVQRCVEHRRDPGSFTLPEARHAADVMAAILDRIPTVGHPNATP